MEQQRVVHQSPKGMWVSKLVLRIQSVIVDIVLIGVSATIGSGWTSPATIFFLPPACVALVWNIAEGICILARGGHRGVHPGACVGVDLCLWLGFAAASTLYLLFGFGWYYEVYVDIYGSSAAAHSSLVRACLAFGYLEMILHIVLFIIACCETNARNRNHNTVFVYQAPPPGMMLAPGYHPQSVVMSPGQYNPHDPRQSIVVPPGYQPAQQGYQGHTYYAPQDGQRGYMKPEADSTPLSVPMVPSPVYESQPERRG